MKKKHSSYRQPFLILVMILLGALNDYAHAFQQQWSFITLSQDHRLHLTVTDEDFKARLPQILDLNKIEGELRFEEGKMYRPIQKFKDGFLISLETKLPQHSKVDFHFWDGLSDNTRLIGRAELDVNHVWKVTKSSRVVAYSHPHMLEISVKDLPMDTLATLEKNNVLADFSIFGDRIDLVYQDKNRTKLIQFGLTKRDKSVKILPRSVEVLSQSDDLFVTNLKRNEDRIQIRRKKRPIFPKTGSQIPGYLNEEQIPQYDFRQFLITDSEDYVFTSQISRITKLVSEDLFPVLTLEANLPYIHALEDRYIFYTEFVESEVRLLKVADVNFAGNKPLPFIDVNNHALLLISD